MALGGCCRGGWRFGAQVGEGVDQLRGLEGAVAAAGADLGEDAGGHQARDGGTRRLERTAEERGRARHREHRSGGQGLHEPVDRRVAASGTEAGMPRLHEVPNPRLERPGFLHCPAAGGGEELDPVVHTPVRRFGVRRSDMAESGQAPEVIPRVARQDERDRRQHAAGITRAVAAPSASAPGRSVRSRPRTDGWSRTGRARPRPVRGPADRRRRRIRRGPQGDRPHGRAAAGRSRRSRGRSTRSASGSSARRRPAPTTPWSAPGRRSPSSPGKTAAKNGRSSTGGRSARRREPGRGGPALPRPGAPEG